MKFSSKIDAWLAIIVGFAAASTFFAAYSLASQTAGVGLLQPLLMVAVAAGLMVWPLVATNYTIRGTDLLIRSGLFVWRVPISEITRMAPTRSVISSPAMSLDRLRIDYGRGKFVLISPQDQQAFMRAIDAAKNAA